MRVVRGDRFVGFCGGVKRAWKLAVESSENDDDEEVFISGKLIHNTPAMQELETMGVRPLPVSLMEDDLPAAEAAPLAGRTVLMRAHGESPTAFARAQSLGLNVLDATCPIVTVVQKIAKQLEDEGYQVVVFGHRDHPEARATVAHTEHGLIIESVAEAIELGHYEKLASIAQTTMLTADYVELCKVLETKADVFDDRGRICGWTQRAQGEAVELARTVDMMVVVGGRDSSNTHQLVRVCSDVCPTRHIVTADELDETWFDGVETVGLAAGASTREYDIAAVISWLEAH